MDKIKHELFKLMDEIEKEMKNTRSDDLRPVLGKVRQAHVELFKVRIKQIEEDITNG